jgi:hypothetical protein
MTKTKAERETIITRASDQKGWHVFTEDPRVVTKLTKLHGPGKQDHQSSDGLVWNLPASCVSFRAVPKPRVLTDEQRRVVGERFAKHRSSEAKS